MSKKEISLDERKKRLTKAIMEMQKLNSESIYISRKLIKNYKKQLKEVSKALEIINNASIKI